jgi:hypothetical protein
MSASVKAFLAMGESPEGRVLPDSLNLLLGELSIDFDNDARIFFFSPPTTASNVVMPSVRPTSAAACPMNSCPSAIFLSQVA